LGFRAFKLFNQKKSGSDLKWSNDLNDADYSKKIKSLDDTADFSLTSITRKDDSMEYDLIFNVDVS